jgi:peptidoglycan/xylan/chitin deacetylase (PgdA/CDA1 family)
MSDERRTTRRRGTRHAKSSKRLPSWVLVGVVVLVAAFAGARVLKGGLFDWTGGAGRTSTAGRAAGGPTRPTSAGGGTTAPPATSDASSAKAAGGNGRPAGEQSPTATAGTRPSLRPGGTDHVLEAALPYPGAPAIPVQESISQTHPRNKLIAITLDDGIPFDMRLLDLLEQHHVQATTFVLGQFAASHPELIRRLKKDGFEIANHSWDHPFLTKLSDSAVRSQISRTQAAISKVTGNQAPYLRPPFGATDSRIKRIAASMGYRIVLWDRTFADTSPSATPRQLYKNVIVGLQPGDIILCHWGQHDTYAAMKLILPELQREGFTPVTLSELLANSK